MITFYYSLAPNPMKVALFLEETGLPYELKPVDTRKGEQHRPEFLALNPNGKVPVIVDQETGATVFDSNAIPTPTLSFSIWPRRQASSCPRPPLRPGVSFCRG